jgi:hypothetical protein
MKKITACIDFNRHYVKSHIWPFQTGSVGASLHRLIIMIIIIIIINTKIVLTKLNTNCLPYYPSIYWPEYQLVNISINN